MRVLFSHYLDDDHQPAAQMVRLVAHELEGLGHTVLVHRSLGPSHDARQGEYVPAGGRVHGGNPVVRALKNRFWFARTLARNRGLRRRDQVALEDFRPDVVLAREDAYRTSIVHEARAAGVPLVTYADVPVAYETRTFHSAHRWHPPQLVERVERWWLSQSRAVITPASPARRELRRYGLGVPIHVIPNGVDPERFPALDGATKRQRREALGIPPRAIVVGFQGSFLNFHGIDLLCELIRATLGKKGIHWLLVGEGPEQPKLMQALAGRSGATLLGRQPPDRMGEFVGLMDVGISTHAFFDPFYLCPLKILEYAAAGCAVVASAQGDIPQLLDGGRRGVLIDRPDPAAWVEALSCLLADPNRIGELGRAAREWVLDHLTWRHTAERVAAVLQAAILETSTDSEKRNGR